VVDDVNQTGVGSMSKTVIVGAGITGLATAHYLQHYELGNSDYTLLEASSRVGGKVTSAQQDGFLVEGGPDSFLTQKTSTQSLCNSLGLSEQLIGSNNAHRPATYVFSGGRMHPMPDGMMLMAPTMILPILRSHLLSWRGKLRMALEILVPRNRGTADESLASFVRRRLGTEVLDKIAAPLMGGIHAADPERLSLQSTFPMFSDMEKSHGSLALGIARRKQHTTPPSAKGSSAKPSSMFTSLPGGLQQLTDTIADQLDSSRVKLNCRVISLTRQSGRYEVALSDGSSISADNIVLTTPAFVTADIVQKIDPFLAAALRGIRYVTTATVSLGFKRSDLTCPLNGYGFIVPAIEGRRITACSWSSTKFAHRAPDNSVLMRIFIGGALAENLAEQDEAALIHLARQELREILGITATPVFAKAFRWPKAVPQYDVGHRSHIAAIEHRVAAYPGLYIAGAAYHGAGIPDCVQSGMNTALKIVTAQDRAECISKETLQPTSRTWENAHAIH